MIRKGSLAFRSLGFPDRFVEIEVSRTNNYITKPSNVGQLSAFILAIRLIKDGDLDEGRWSGYGAMKLFNLSEPKFRLLEMLSQGIGLASKNQEAFHRERV